MKLKYAGPKPHISHHGISFDTNKEDKYVYLNIVIQLLKALSHDYFEDKTYIYNAQSDRIDDLTLYDELTKFCPDIENLTEKQNHNIEDEIDENMLRAKNSQSLTEDDIEVLTNNIKIMHDYIVQRSINKSVYYCAIHALAELLKKDHIDHILTPMYQNFVHVLNSVQGVLEQEKFPIDTKLDIYKNKEGQLVVKLQVINL